MVILSSSRPPKAGLLHLMSAALGFYSLCLTKKIPNTLRQCTKIYNSVCLVDYIKSDFFAVSGGAVIPQSNLQQYCPCIHS